MKLQRNKQKKINGKKWFFEKINKNGKPPDRLNQDKGEKKQIANIRNERGDISIDH